MENPKCVETNLDKRATKREPLMNIIVECPVCLATLCHQDKDVQENFCPKCGQAINWYKINELLPKIKEILKERDE